MAPASVNSSLSNCPRQPICVTRALHHCPAGRGFPTHEQRNADDPFIADDSNFRRRAVRHHIQQRHDRIGGEVDVAHWMPDS